MEYLSVGKISFSHKYYFTNLEAERPSGEVFAGITGKIDEMIRLLTLSIGSGLLLWAGFDWPNIFILIGAIVFLFWLILKQAESWSEALLAGSVAGTVYALSFLAWHWSVLPLDWAGVTNNFFGSLLVFYTLFLPSLLIGISVGAWAMIVHNFKNREVWLIIIAPILWPLIEFGRSVDLSILWFGQGGIIGPTWTLGFLGYALASFPPILWWAGIGGVYLLSAITVLGGVLIYLRRPWLLLICGLIILAPLWAQKQIMPKLQTKIPIAVVTTNFPSFSRVTPEQSKSLREEKLRLIKEVDALLVRPTVAIFPEDTRVKLETGSWPRNPSLVIDSARVNSGAGDVSLVFEYINNESGQSATSGKRFLVPHGEYMPYITDLLGGVLGKSEWVKGFRQKRGTAKVEKEKIIKAGDLSLAATACSEIMLPGVYAKQAAGGVDFLINAASHSLFRGSKQLYGQTVRMAQVRAAESGRALVESSNGVPSFLINPQGQLVWESKWGREGADLVWVSVAKNNTFYSYLAALFSSSSVLK